MSEVLLIDNSGRIQRLNLADARLPADGSWNWAKNSLNRLTGEWQQCNKACPGLGKQFTNNKGLSVITQGDLTDVYRHVLKFSEPQIAQVGNQITPLAGASISQAMAEGQHYNAVAFADTPQINGHKLPSHGYGNTSPQTVITGSPYREGANVFAHELAHAGDRNAAGDTGLHSDSRLFEMVMEIDRAQRGKHSALAHTEEFYRRAGGVLGNTRNEETLARMVENVVRNPEGDFHPVVKAYVNDVFLKDMELKAAGFADKRIQLRLATNFVDGHDMSMLALHQDIKSAPNTVDTAHAANKTLKYINTIAEDIATPSPVRRPKAPANEPVPLEEPQPARAVPKSPVEAQEAARKPAPLPEDPIPTGDGKGAKPKVANPAQPAAEPLSDNMVTAKASINQVKMMLSSAQQAQKNFMDAQASGSTDIVGRSQEAFAKVSAQFKETTGFDLKMGKTGPVVEAVNPATGKTVILDAHSVMADPKSLAKLQPTPKVVPVAVERAPPKVEQRGTAARPEGTTDPTPRLLGENPVEQPGPAKSGARTRGSKPVVKANPVEAVPGSVEPAGLGSETTTGKTSATAATAAKNAAMFEAVSGQVGGVMGVGFGGVQLYNAAKHGDVVEGALGAANVGSGSTLLLASSKALGSNSAVIGQRAGYVMMGVAAASIVYEASKEQGTGADDKWAYRGARVATGAAGFAGGWLAGAQLGQKIGGWQGAVAGAAAGLAVGMGTSIVGDKLIESSKAARLEEKARLAPRANGNGGLNATNTRAITNEVVVASNPAREGSMLSSDPRRTEQGTIVATAIRDPGPLPAQISGGQQQTTVAQVQTVPQTGAGASTGRFS